MTQTLRGVVAGVVALLVACCSPAGRVDEAPPAGAAVPLRHAQTFSIVQRDGYHVVDIEASVVSWGGSAGGSPQRARLVLVPRDITPPTLRGDLAGATVIRTPVQRIAVNDQPHEAMLRALGLSDRLVAVGGHSSYDDTIRARVKSGQIRHVGYGWHQPPTLDALVAARPDVFLARMADLTHTKHMERIEALGIPVVPVFLDAEPHYMGRVEWVRLVGLLAGKEREAEALVAEVQTEVDRLKAVAARQPQRSLLWAWYASGGDRWSVTQRNADAALIRDANLELVLGEPNDPELDGFSRLSTERLLRDAVDADCWMIRDPLSSRYSDPAVLGRFKAYREGCVWRQHGLKNPQADAWEIWEMGTIRPDWILADLIRMGHPPLRDGALRYHAPETWEGADAGAGSH